MSNLQPFQGETYADRSAYQELMGQAQRLRGRVYLKDGAIRESDLTSDGRHVSKVDEKCWHLLTLSSDNIVMGCARFFPHSPSAPFEDLTVSQSSLAKCPDYGDRLREAVEAEMAIAREANFIWLEMGGWALSEELRGTTEALLYALATYAWSQLMGGALGISTATERNCSASILKRLGGRSLEQGGSALPAYYDENYRCQMEVLRFDSRSPNPKYRSTVETLRNQMSFVPVVSTGPVSAWSTNVPEFYVPSQGSSYQLALPSAS